MDKIIKFMYGRYGIDELYKFLLIFYIILLTIGLFTNNLILDLLQIFILVIMIYRVFSRKIYERSNENQQYIKIKNKILKPFTNIKLNIQDKKHIYKKCNKCKTTLKLPLPTKIGIKHAKCPNCNNKVTLFALKKEKIEIIKNR